ncbi:MAG: MBL fold metallo-hydrolase [bacterium]|nr:MBL fold metallo-hydrolase [bacterium]
MKIQKFLHSCLLVEENGTRILIDPGLYSFIEGRVKPEDFKNINAILITHEHPDHVDSVALKVILKNNPLASVYGNGGVVEFLKKEGIMVLIFEEGEKRIGGVPILARFAQHGTVLSKAPKNTAYIIDGKLLIGGDSLDEELERLKGIEVLALPITAPWHRAIDAVAFAAAIGPKTIIPIHDGFVKDFFLKGRYAAFSKSFTEIKIDFHPLEVGEIFEI